MLFSSREELKAAIDTFNIKDARDIKYVRNEKSRVRMPGINDTHFNASMVKDLIMVRILKINRDKEAEKWEGSMPQT
ncbi:hypothetical protein Leryth_017645 [Lithospermum erythrorhizon]|nr:hypothetical protein Leryth_017645 [Lithospermum erythrorhizon]